MYNTLVQCITCTNTHYFIAGYIQFINTKMGQFLHFYLFYLQLNRFQNHANSSSLIIFSIIISAVWISQHIQSISFYPMGNQYYFFSPSLLAHLQYTFFCLFLMACVSSGQRFKVERHKDFAETGPHLVMSQVSTVNVRAHLSIYLKTTGD